MQEKEVRQEGTGKILDDLEESNLGIRIITGHIHGTQTSLGTQSLSKLITSSHPEYQLGQELPSQLVRGGNEGQQRGSNPA